jgi:hypothetical protein
VSTAQVKIATSNTGRGLRGSWAWANDVITLDESGTGTYVRSGTVCYELTYTVERDTIEVVADRASTCIAVRVNAYRFEVRGDTMLLTHIKSGFDSTWQRQP